MKDEELWNKMLLTPQWGDIVKFKYGKVHWLVFAAERINGKLCLKLLRHLNKKPYVYYKEIVEGTWEYKNMRIIETIEQRKQTS